MLTPDPRHLRSLLARYADLRIAHSRGETGLEQQLDDVTYTLCVTTATTRIEDALATADALLARSADATASPGLEAARTELAA